MTGAEVGTFLGSGSTNGAVFDRSDPRTTTAPQPSTIMKPVRTPWKGSGPVFNGSVDSWVALANPVPRVQRESAFHKPPDWFGPGISLDPRSSNFPCWRDRRRVRPVRGFEPSDPLTWSAIPLDRGGGSHERDHRGFERCLVLETGRPRPRLRERSRMLRLVELAQLDEDSNERHGLVRGASGFYRSRKTPG